jgi:hypothetical protein
MAIVSSCCEVRLVPMFKTSVTHVGSFFIVKIINLTKGQSISNDNRYEVC